MKPGLGRFADGTFGQVTPTLLPVNVCKKATEHCSLVLWNSIKASVCQGKSFCFVSQTVSTLGTSLEKRSTILLYAV